MNRDTPPAFSQLHQTLSERLSRCIPLMWKLGAIADGYRPWRKVRLIARDLDLDPEDAWFALKWSRLTTRQELPLRQANGNPFWWSAGNHLHEPLHRIDRATGGGGPAPLESPRGLLSDNEHRRRLAIRSLMDEAAESSLIEGAATTRKDAIEMLRSSRAPMTPGERMVVNNYAAMQQIKRWLDRPLSPDMLLELQEMLTRGTLSDEGECGRFRRQDENVRVVDDRDSSDIYVPPPAELIPRRLAALCEFANAQHRGASFMHPIIKASILHFMIGYEHPFADGNGRTARAVFYWHALRHGYKIFEFMPISDRIRAGYARYPQAFLDTELDDGDLTYFVLYKLDIIEQSLDRFTQHLEREEEKIRQAQTVLRLSKDLNLRQQLLAGRALRHPNARFTVKSHANSNDIVPVTARKDLEGLVKARIFVTTKRGKEVIYLLAPDVPQRLAKFM